MGRIKIVLMMCCISVLLKSSAQTDTLTTEQIDAQSYSLYLEQNWKALAEYTEDMLNQNIDFYYLRLRGGVAYYELEQYRRATIHFERAQQMNPFETTANEYLYWCYTYSGRIEEALKLSKKIKLNFKIPVIYSVTTEAGIKISSNQSLANNMHYGFAGVNHRVKNVFTLFHGFTYLQQETHWGNYTQYQYYLKARLPLKKGWYINPAIHLVQLNAAPYNKDLYTLGNISIEKQLSRFILAAGYNYSDFFNRYQHQSNISVTWFPIKKQTAWITCTPTYLNIEAQSSRLFVAANMGYSFKNKSTLQISTMNGGARNFSEANGFLINNSVDLVKNKYSLQYNYPLTPNKEIYGIAVTEQREEFFKLQNFQYYSLIIGLRYKP
jgi:hypothetical protein